MMWTFYGKRWQIGFIFPFSVNRRHKKALADRSSQCFFSVFQPLSGTVASLLDHRISSISFNPVQALLAIQPFGPLGGLCAFLEFQSYSGSASRSTSGTHSIA